MVLNEFIDLFYFELRNVMRFGIFLFFALLAIVFILGGLISLFEWIYVKICNSRI